MDAELLKTRALDTALACETTQKPKFLGFLSAEEAVFVEKLLQNKNKCFELYGGFASAQRVYLCCFPAFVNTKAYPFCAITVRYRKVDKLSHRDFLGSLMALGLKRETIGDILIEEGRAVLFVNNDISNYIISQLSKVGKIGVKCELGFTEPLPSSNQMCEFSVTVASDRLDCVVAALINCSRAKANEKIALGFVSVNSVVCQKNTKTVTNKDAISVRGSGKFIIENFEGITRKNRLILKFKKYV